VPWKIKADFINKIIIVEEEADECIYCLELMEESGLVNSESLIFLKKEPMNSPLFYRYW